MKNLVLLLLSFWVATAVAEDKFPGIKNLMTAKEFEDAGLNQLSDEELEKLNAWLVNYTAGEAQVLAVVNEEVKEAQTREESAIVTRIQGDFSGWTGKTVFRMENGQVWRQRLSGRYQYSGPANPEVSISRNFMGFYEMTINETGKSVGVKLVK